MPYMFSCRVFIALTLLGIFCSPAYATSPVEALDSQPPALSEELEITLSTSDPLELSPKDPPIQQENLLVPSPYTSRFSAPSNIFLVNVGYTYQSLSFGPAICRNAEDYTGANFGFTYMQPFKNSNFHWQIDSEFSSPIWIIPYVGLLYEFESTGIQVGLSGHAFCCIFPPSAVMAPGWTLRVPLGESMFLSLKAKALFLTGDKVSLGLEFVL